MQSVNAILAFTLQIYDRKVFSIFFEKGVDKRGKMWYNNITVSESKAVDE